MTLYDENKSSSDEKAHFETFVEPLVIATFTFYIILFYI